MNKTIEDLKAFLEDLISEMKEYRNDENCDDLDYHDCGIAQEAYELVLSYVKDM